MKKFFERTCSIIKKVSGKPVIPVFFTSGNFSQDAIKYLERKNKSKKMKPFLDLNFPSSIYYDRKDLLEYLNSKNRKFKERRRVIKEYFRRKPSK